MDIKYVELFRALADETRQEILEFLEEHEHNVNEICDAFGRVTQPTISHHLQILKRSNLVMKQRKGKKVYYIINKKVLRNGVEGFIAQFDIQIL
ncbi:MAG: metalloregulator ArsR/SmtB family transcription factor [Candidatus Omnitrophica bacterium]|nr:metalloregulator ArsR/SmtB family transcription factor [Candidatus Omnitrophota bacterium]